MITCNPTCEICGSDDEVEYSPDYEIWICTQCYDDAKALRDQ